MAFIIVLLHTRNPFDKFLANREGLGIALPFREPELNLFRLEIGDGVKIIIRFSFNLRSIHLHNSDADQGCDHRQGDKHQHQAVQLEADRIGGRNGRRGQCISSEPEQGIKHTTARGDENQVLYREALLRSVGSSSVNEITWPATAIQSMEKTA